MRLLSLFVYGSGAGLAVGHPLPLRCLGRRSRSSRAMLCILFLSLSLIEMTLGQKDPVGNFCRRFGHQTAIVDDKLYIDGGLLNWNPIQQYPTNYSNNFLLFQNLDTVAASGMPQLYANLSKNGSIPNVHGGTLWADDVNKRLYLFGGEFYQEPPTSFSLFSYDILENDWDYIAASRQNSIQGISYGAGVSVPSRGEGYYYGGWHSNTSVPSWGDLPPVATSYLVKYSMDANSWTNSSGPDEIRRAEGVIVHIPAGDGGMLVYLGGVQDLFGNGTVSGQPMDEIYIYDVLSAKWYTQRAIGAVPEMRRRFCGGVAWAADQSSYNIYIYGGAGMPPNTAGFDDIYVLSLPSFTWIRVYPADRNTTGDFPHHSLSCNVYSGAQMLIIGGSFPLTDACDSPDQWGTHNLDMGKQNPNNSPWELFEPSKKSYVVPDVVIAAVGGDGRGGATKTVPDAGFDHSDLKVLMTRKASVAVRTPTRDVSGPGGSGRSGLSTGAIAGIAVAGAIVLLGALLGCFCLLRRRRRKQREEAAAAGVAAGQPVWSPTTGPFSPASPYSHQSLYPPQPPAELSAADNTIHYAEMPSTMHTDQYKFDNRSGVWVPQVSLLQHPASPRPPQSLSPPIRLGSAGAYGDESPGGASYGYPTSGTDDTGRSASPRSRIVGVAGQEPSPSSRTASMRTTGPVHQTYYHP